MLLSPLVILLIRMAMPEDQLVASVAAGAVLLVINLFLNAASYVMEESDETSCMSKGGFLFLFPKKQGLFHMAVCLVHTFLFGALVEHAFHPQTTEQSSDWIAIGMVLTAFSSYSLFSENCPESAIYVDNDQDFRLGSNHFQRPLYMIIVSAGLACLSYIVEDFD